MPYTKDQLLELLRRNVDADGWLDQVMADPDGAAAVGALLAEFEREAQAVERLEALGLAETAPGGSPGSCTLTATREASGTAGTIPAGFPFVDARGVRARVASDTPVAAGALSVPILLFTERRTELVNAEEDYGWRVAPDADPALDEDILTVLMAPAGNPNLLDTSFQEFSATPVHDGASDWLALHGRERGAPRQPGESTGDYRSRVRNIPDAVSPIAVADGVQAAAPVLGIGAARLLEPFGDGATQALKDDHGLGEFSGLYLTGAFTPSISSSPKRDFLDDAGSGYELLSNREARAYLRAHVAQPRNPDGLGMFLGGSYLDDPIFGFMDTGSHPAVVAALMAMWAEVDRKAAAGVLHDVYVDTLLYKIGRGSTSSAGETVVFTLTPPAGLAWLLAWAWADHDRAAAPPDPATMGHRVTFTFTDATTFSTPVSGTVQSERLDPGSPGMAGYPWGKRVSQIQGKITGPGAATLGMVGTFRILEAVNP